ncbi:universal stress protein [Billgrantia aerodenitrificans]|uniref:Universal stress protein n=1 Tax=Billgrantia aerodenitrificans TaxID=2733483 RepID=A0ABS9AP21_9GAMM|nr:universal stress protein [Halomonas aerodenitrificans]MCE8023377.1 universal stress protein [Halomonas aerodenitrificans]
MAFKINRLLYATDLGPRGPDVFRCAASIADQYGADIHIVHVIEEPSIIRNNIAERYISSSVLGGYRESTLDQAISEIKRRLEQFSRSTLESEEAVNARVAEIRVLTGRPGRTILAEADHIDADCIVLGSRRYAGVNDMIIGSVARKVTLKSRRPVFLFPV